MKPLKKHGSATPRLWPSAVMALLLVPLSGADCAPPSVAEGHHLATTSAAADDGWLRREIRHFRSYGHRDRAYRLEAAGDLEQASQELAQYLAIDPHDHEVRLEYLVLLHRLKRHDDVIREADTLLARRPGLAPARLYRAMASDANGDDAGALREFSAVADGAGVRPEQRVFALGMALDVATRQGATEAALAAAERLAELAPSAETHAKRGRVLESLGRLQEADSAFETAIGLSQDGAERLRLREARATLAAKRSDWRTAERELREILDATPDEPVVVRRLGELSNARHDGGPSVCLVSAGGVSGRAEDPQRPGNIVHVAADRSGTQQATRVAPAGSRDVRHRVLFALGHGYMKLGKIPEAVAAFRDAARIKPDVPTLTAFADALERAGRPAEAAATLEPIADRDPTGDIHLKVATVYAKLRRWDDALVHLAATVTADGTPRIKREAYKQQGFIYYGLERYGEARQAFERSAEYGAADLAVFTALGETCMKLNAYEDAVKYLKQALLLTEDDKAVR